MSARSDLVASLVAESTGVRRDFERLWHVLRSVQKLQSFCLENWSDECAERAALLHRLQAVQADLSRVSQKALTVDLAYHDAVRDRDNLSRDLVKLREENAEMRARIQASERGDGYS